MSSSERIHEIGLSRHILETTTYFWITTRKTGAGKNPIYFECVPEGTNGTFNLLFVPLTGPELSDDETREDLRAVARGVKAMMTYYGFGAKTSSGFGTAEVDPENTIILPDNFKPLWDNGLKDENK